MAPDFPASGMPPMIGKALSLPEWLDYIAAYNFGTIPPTRLVLHHTYIPNEQQWRGLASMQGMQRFYAGKGWTAAPHLYAAPDGIWLFTPMRDVGIHAGTGNSGVRNGQFWYSIGLEMVGYFDRERPQGQVWEFSKAIMGSMSRRLGIAPRDLISFHRDYTTTKSCPGWAITKEWVWAEVDAWLANTQAAPVALGAVGTPSPEHEALIEVLMEEGYKRRGEGYNSDWSFHQYATQHNLGLPIAKSTRLSADGKQYGYQVFARDTLYNEIPNWGDVRRMSDLNGTATPAGGLGRALLDATYRAGGAAFHPDWAFHQYALTNRLGPPIGESTTIVVDGVKYAYQVFAQDTLFNRVPNWQAVQRLSALATVADAPNVRLREALLTQTYRAGGTTYHPEWAFHQIARKLNLGAPLSGSYQVAQGSTTYAIQVYATDVLYNVVPNWADVRRLTGLLPVVSATLFGARTSDMTTDGVPEEDLSVLLSPNAVMEPDQAPFRVVRYSSAQQRPSATSTRSGSRVSALIVHDDGGPALERINEMMAPGSRESTHYYVTKDGVIYGVVDEQDAAWHAGMAQWEGRRRNLNRNSIGITIEDAASASATQRDAFLWLVGILRKRYRLPASAVVRWSDLSDAPDTFGSFPVPGRRRRKLKR